MAFLDSLSNTLGSLIIIGLFFYELSMGQTLSIPLVILGFLILKYERKKIHKIFKGKSLSLSRFIKCLYDKELGFYQNNKIGSHLQLLRR